MIPKIIQYSHQGRIAIRVEVTVSARAEVAVAARVGVVVAYGVVVVVVDGVIATRAEVSVVAGGV